MVWEGNPNPYILHRLFLLPGIIEEGTYRCLYMVLHLSSLCTSPDMEMVTEDLTKIVEAGEYRQERGRSLGKREKYFLKKINLSQRL